MCKKILCKIFESQKHYTGVVYRMCIFFYMGVFYHRPGDSSTMGSLHFTILSFVFCFICLKPLRIKKIFFHTNHAIWFTQFSYCPTTPTLPTALDRRQRMLYGQALLTHIIITHYNYVHALSICVYIIHQLIDVCRSKVGALDSVCSERQRKVKGYLQ